jgi:hypothetical protein
MISAVPVPPGIMVVSDVAVIAGTPAAAAFVIVATPPAFSCGACTNNHERTWRRPWRPYD